MLFIVDLMWSVLNSLLFKGSRLLGCEALSVGEWCLVFWKNTVPLSWSVKQYEKHNECGGKYGDVWKQWYIVGGWQKKLVSQSGPRCIDVSMKRGDHRCMVKELVASCCQSAVGELVGSGKAALGLWCWWRWNMKMVWYREYSLVTGPSTTEWAVIPVIVQ